MMARATVVPAPEHAVQANPEKTQEHPRDSGPRWAITSGRCQCARCGRFFGGVVTFDLHQVLTRDGGVVCLSDDLLRQKRLRSVGGWWGRIYRGDQSRSGGPGRDR